MTTDPKADLHRYLVSAREALLWKVDGLSEYDVRRPLTPTGTNLLGLVKHVASMADVYLGDTFHRRSGEPLPWLDDDAEPNDDLWVTPDESREQIIAFWHRCWAHADATVDALGLDDSGEVPWWSAERRAVTLHQILVHMLAETNRHAGHADIVRELVDGTAGLRSGGDNLPEVDAGWWQDYRVRLERSAASFADPGDLRWLNRDRRASAGTPRPERGAWPTAPPTPPT